MKLRKILDAKDGLRIIKVATELEPQEGYYFYAQVNELLDLLKPLDEMQDQFLATHLKEGQAVLARGKDDVLIFQLERLLSQAAEAEVDVKIARRISIDQITGKMKPGDIGALVELGVVVVPKAPTKPGGGVAKKGKK